MYTSLFLFDCLILNDLISLSSCICIKHLGFEAFNRPNLTYSSSFEESEFDSPPIVQRQAVTMASSRCWPFRKA